MISAVAFIWEGSSMKHLLHAMCYGICFGTKVDAGVAACAHALTPNLACLPLASDLSSAILQESRRIAFNRLPNNPAHVEAGKDMAAKGLSLWPEARST